MKSIKDIFDPKFWERDSITYEDLPMFREVLGAADLVGLARRVLALVAGRNPTIDLMVMDPFRTSCKIAGAVHVALSWESKANASKTVMVPYALYRADVYTSEIKCLVVPGWVDLADVAKGLDTMLDYTWLEEPCCDSTRDLPEAGERKSFAIKTRVVEKFPIEDVLAARVWLGSDTCSPSFVEDFLAKVVYEQFPESLGLLFEFDEATEPYRDFDDCENAVIESDEKRTAFGHLEHENDGKALSLCEKAVAKLNNDARLDFLRRLNDLNRKLEVVEG